jgi:hypothetical protein
MFVALAKADTTNPDRRRFLGTAHRIAGQIALERGNTVEALRAAAASRALLDPQLAKTPVNAVWQTSLARTLTLSSYALMGMGRAAEGESDARRAISILEPLLVKRPTDQSARLALGDAVQRRGDEAEARRAWTGALTAVDSVTRATGVAELRGLKSTALVSLGRVDEARPLVRTLEQQGFRTPSWRARMRAAGLLTQQ